MDNEIKETELRQGTGPAEEDKEPQKENREEKEDRIVYSNDVISTIAGMAINDVTGFAGVCTPSGAVINRSKSAGKGVRVTISSGDVSVDVCVIAEYGTPIQKAAAELQDNVRKAVESMTGLHVVKVDVRVQNISFEKENAPLPAGTAAPALAAAGSKKTPGLNAAKIEETAAADDKSGPARDNRKTKNTGKTAPQHGVDKEKKA